MNMTQKERYLDLEDIDGRFPKAHVFIGDGFVYLRLFNDEIGPITFRVDREQIVPLAEHLAKAVERL